MDLEVGRPVKAMLAETERILSSGEALLGEFRGEEAEGIAGALDIGTAADVEPGEEEVDFGGFDFEGGA